MWTLDPIDGTKGFLRGEQYAVCLAFLVDAKVQVGVMGCPNLPVDASKPDGPKGCLFVAVRGQGAEQVRMLTQYDFPILILIPVCSPRDLSQIQSPPNSPSLTLETPKSTSSSPSRLHTPHWGSMSASRSS